MNGFFLWCRSCEISLEDMLNPWPVIHLIWSFPVCEWGSGVEGGYH